MLTDQRNPSSARRSIVELLFALLWVAVAVVFASSRSMHGFVCEFAKLQGTAVSKLRE